jgi:hypothetical protein
MSEQMEDVNTALESDETEDAYEGDLGDAAKTRGTGAGIIGLGSCI